MRKAATIAFLATIAATVIGLVATALADDRPVAFTLGVGAAFPALELRPGSEACQAPIAVSEEFSAVLLSASVRQGAGPPLAVAVRELPGGRVLGAARVAPGYRGEFDNVRASFPEPIPAERRIALCARNVGERPVQLLGGKPRTAKGTALLDGQPRPSDITAVFLRSESVSILSLLPDIVERAALFHPAWVGEWTFWLLIVLVLIGAPALMLGALLAASPPPRGLDPPSVRAGKRSPADGD
jgi:hypothetical protein